LGVADGAGDGCGDGGGDDVGEAFPKTSVARAVGGAAIVVEVGAR